MSDDAKVQIAVCTENAITTICFTLLAIVFGKWWIVFCACLFYTKFTRGKNNE